jgi:hypothetical protein
MQLVDFRTNLRARIGNPTTAEVPDATLTDLINDAASELADRFEFHDVRKIVTFPTVAPVGTVTTTRYNIPADCLAVLSVWNTGSTANPTAQGKLEKRDEAWLAQQQTDPTNPITGIPLAYVRQRDWIELSPAPDDVYTIRLTYKATNTMVQDTDTPVTPVTWDKGILHLARAKFYDEIRLDTEKAKWAFTVYETWVQSKPVEVEEEDFADNVEGVVMPTLSRFRLGPLQPRSSNDFDRMN